MITCLLSLAAASLGIVAGCRDTLAPEARLPRGPEARIQITVPAGGQRGDTIALALDITAAGGDTATATQGTFRFRAGALRFLGQSPLDTLFPVVAVDFRDSAAGRLRVLAVDPGGLPAHGVVLVFEVQTAGYADGLGYTHELGATAGDILDNGGRTVVVPGAVRRPAALVPGGWPAGLRRAPVTARLIDSVPTGRRYGDVDGNGVINVLDVAWVANWAVGNQAPAGQPIPVVGDLRELVGNVAPANLPGLGEAGDAKGPGWDAACQRRLDVLDAAELGNEAVGNWRPVVGDTIPASAVDPATRRPRRGSACQVVVPALPPSGFDPALRDSFFLAANMLTTPEGYVFAPRNLITIAFTRTATQAERQAVMDVLGGVVVGGSPLDDGAFYYVKVPPVSTSDELLALLTFVESFQQVDFALIAGETHLNYRTPRDGPGFFHWQVTPRRADSANWALEAIGAPLAWGCETGDSSLTIAIVDNDFGSDSLELDPNRDPRSNAVLLAPGTLANFHGKNVASVLGAVADNREGISGLMWRAKLLMTNDLLTDFEGDVKWAGVQGARAINISQGVNWWYVRPPGYRPHTAADTAVQEFSYLRLRRALGWLDSLGKRPLIVISAGNDNVDAWWNGTSAVVADFPDRVIVVGGVKPTAGQVVRWDSSNTGSLVDLFAPASAISYLGSNGVEQGSGTSFAAPFVTATAGLLLSAIPGLTATEMKQLIIAGSSASGLMVDGKPVLNVYDVLRLAAERSGAPLCGNRLWTEGTRVRVQRGGATETLKDVGQPLINVTATHGGKRVIYSTTQGVGAIQYRGSSSAWELEPVVPADTFANGITSSLSHQRDSVATVFGWGGGPIDVEIGALGGPVAYSYTLPLSPRVSHPLCELELDSSRVDGLPHPVQCLQSFDAGLNYSPYPSDDNPGYDYSIQYSTAGDEVYLSIPTWQQHMASRDSGSTCPFSSNPALVCYGIQVGWQVTGGTVYAINIQTGSRRIVDSEVGRGIWQIGVSESNQQLVSVRGAYQYNYVRRWWLGDSGGPFGSFSNCAWEFTPINGATAPAGQSFPLPAGSACTGSPHRGTFAPLRATRRPRAQAH